MRRERKAAGFNRRIRKTVCPVVWEGGGASIPVTRPDRVFRLLGTPEADKRHVVYESGHHPPRNESVKETLSWLDRYLGPVQ